MTPTPTVTPPSVPVTIRLVIQETPLAQAPLMINATPVTTDANGEVVTMLWTTHMYAISSALEAISFPPIADTGENFSAQSPVILAADRLVRSLNTPCRTFISGAPAIYFSTLNSTDRALNVPLTMPDLNSLWSVTGQGAPPEWFAPGTSGFTVPESYFGASSGLQGIWKFLGQEITISGVPDVCVSQAIPGACDTVDAAALFKPREYTRKVIMRLARQSTAAARSGRWKGTNGSFAIPFLARGAKSLAVMDKSMRIVGRHNFVCPYTPSSCSRKSIPKATLKKAFQEIFAGKPPRGLEHLYARAAKETKSFEQVLKKIPNAFITCGK